MPLLSDSSQSAARQALQYQIVRTVFLIYAGTCGFALAALLLLAQRVEAQPLRVMVAGYLVLGGASLCGLRLPPRWAGHALAALILLSLVMVGLNSAANGWGYSAPGLLFFGLLVAIANVVGTASLGLVATALAMGVVVVLGAGQWWGWLPMPAGRTPPLALMLASHLVAVATGATVGRLVAGLIARHIEAAELREDRFRALLGIATVAYWEMDTDLRVRRIEVRGPQRQFQPVPQALGHTPWTLTALQFDERADGVLRRALGERQAVRDLPVTWHHRDGRVRQLLASGEPRLSATGKVLGYWGVARDVTDQHRGRQALQRSENLLSLVVAMSPDIITLTDLHSGRYVMVNDSFCRVLGRPLDEVVGRTAIELGVWRDLADRDRLVQEVARHGAARDLVIDFNVAGGRVTRLVVAATRFAQDGQDYLLINARDITDLQRLQLEREAMLAHASIGIAFTRERRFELANAFFEQMLGWAPGTLAGQPGAVVWPGEADYQALGAEVGPALARGEVVHGERTARRRDGSEFTMRFAAKAIDPQHPAGGGTIWIAEDVTGARQAAQDLARARDAAEAANQAKSAFLASTSHEIRTPLNGLLGMARLARQPGVEPARLRVYLDQIAESAETLSQLISDILDLSKIEAGKLEVACAPFALDALLQSLQQAYGALAAAHGLRFEVRLDTALPAWALGDALRLRQVLVNLLHNALKFTSAGSVALHGQRLADGWVRFEVRDTGPGIDTATQARLFQPFTQADQSVTRRFGGTGLGLSISRELTQLMGGRIGVDSVPGQGSCFHITLPLPAVAPPAAALAEPPDGGDPRLHGLRVLLVEDNAVNMVIGTTLLEHWGITVTQAEDGVQALAAVADAESAGRPIALVLMDVQMPGISGYEATRRLRERWRADQLPVIALTAAALVSERERALGAGMSDFLTKPVDPPKLHAALLNAMAAQADNAANAASVNPG